MREILNQNRYFYVTLLTPAGTGCQFWKGVRHPLHKAELTNFQTAMARQLSLAAGGQLIPSEAILITNVFELEDEVAATYFPDDFKPVVDIA